MFLVKGTIDIGSYNLIIESSGNIQGGTATSYVITGTDGLLTKSIPNGGASTIFAVGSHEHYAPVKITNHSNSAGNFMVNAHPEVLANGTSGADLSLTQSVVNTSWHISSELTAGININLELFWNTSMEVNGFDHSQAYISHYTTSNWNTSAIGAATYHGAGSYSLELTELLSLSPFAVFDLNTVTAIPELNTSTDIQIFPNLTSDFINVKFANPQYYSLIKIIGLAGNEIASYKITNPITPIDVSQFAAGLYVVSVDNKFAGKFVKE